MKSSSHKRIGQFLAAQHFYDLSPMYIRAFMLGCVQPDKNPTTYLKGSIRFQWLRGHNYENSCRYMIRLCRRMERKKTLTLADYYQLGKLMHYVADSFTYAHNREFGGNLRRHRLYEQRLDVCLRKYISRISLDAPTASRAEDVIRMNRRLYCTLPHSTVHDVYFSLITCYGVLSSLLGSKIKSFTILSK